MLTHRVSDEQRDNLRVLAIQVTHWCKALAAALEHSGLMEEEEIKAAPRAR